MNINWSIRLKNPVWWAHVMAAMLIPIFGYYGSTVKDMTTWNDVITILVAAIKNPYVLSCGAIGAWNAIFDPTSKGMSDCKGVLAQKDVR